MDTKEDLRNRETTLLKPYIILEEVQASRQKIATIRLLEEDGRSINDLITEVYIGDETIATIRKALEESA